MAIGRDRKFNALVLAGSTNDEPLRRFSESRSKAAIRLYGRLMIEYVLEALLGARFIRSVAVAGAPDLASLPMDLKQSVRWIKSGSTVPSTLALGLSEVQSSDRVLVVACDIPLITATSVDAFLDEAKGMSQDVIYPVVARRVIQKAFPRVTKAHFRLRDGVFVGGNMALVPAQLTSHHHRILEKATKWTFHPGTLAGILGWRGFTRLALSRVTLSELESIVSHRLKTRVRALPSDEAGIGLDIDGPEEYVSALRLIGSRIGRIGNPIHPAGSRLAKQTISNGVNMEI